MEGTSTRQRALDAALELFSRKGYHGVSMGDIADALGIKAPSLYKHFKGKEEIYAALTPMVEAHYNDLWQTVAGGLEELERVTPAEGLLSADRLESQTLAWFSAELAEPQGERCYRLANQMAGEAPDALLWARPVALYEDFFSALIAREVLRRGDPHVMAVEFLAPLFQLLARRFRSPEAHDDCLEEAKRHIRQFHRVFARREPRAPQGGVSRLFRR